MGQLPPVFKEINNPDSPLHIGGILNGFEPLCGKFPESEMDLIGWISSRGWSPDESYCSDSSRIM